MQFLQAVEDPIEDLRVLLRLLENFGHEWEQRKAGEAGFEDNDKIF